MAKTITRLSLAPTEMGALGRFLFENSISDGVIIMDPVGRIEATNSTLPRLLGYAKNAELTGKLPNFLFAGNADRGSYKKFISELVKNGHWSGTSYARRPDGSVVPLNLNFSALEGPRGTHHYCGTCSVVLESEDFTAWRDPLTKLLKEDAFKSRLNHILTHTERRGSSVAVAVLDVDGFRNIVEKYDHVSGDTIIVNMANILKEILGQNEPICRIRADKFMFLVEDSQEHEDLAVKLQDIFEALSAPHALHDKIEVVPISMGVATYPTSGRTAERLISSAIEANARAKENGGMQIDFHNLFLD